MIFKEKVYKVVRNIPPGKTLTYSEVARRAGNPKAHRAVGNILHNSPLDVPCHRVVSKSGKLAANFGKGWYRKTKRAFGERENSYHLALKILDKREIIL